MANRNNKQQGNRRPDFGRIDRSKGYGRPMAPVSPWQQGGPGILGSVLPLATSSEATLALANNLISNLLQSRQNTVPPSLLDMPMRRDFGGDQGFNRGFNLMGNQPMFAPNRRGPGNFARPADRPNVRRNFRPNDGQRKQGSFQKKDDAKPKQAKQSSAEVAKKDGSTPKKDSKEQQPSDVGDNDVSMEVAPADTADAEKEDEKNDAPKTAYDDINPSLLQCHICNKVMWDGRSFENHLNGRAHHIMMQKAAESYALTADTMREELKIREVKHYRKLGQPTPCNFFCAMCNMYDKDGASHRTTVGHRKLKKYLHPSCASCHKEMATRTELDEHRLTPEHMMQLQARRKEYGGKAKSELMVISNLEQEESYVRHDKKDGSGKRAHDSANPGTDEKEENAEQAVDEQDAENVIVDAKEDDELALTSDQIPKYKPTRGVGQSLLTEMTCMHCRLCRKLLDSKETADVHVRTWRHHVLFVKMLRRKLKDDEQTQAGKRPSADSTDGGVAAKRAKTDEAAATNGDQNDNANADETEEGCEDSIAGDDNMGETEDVSQNDDLVEADDDLVEANDDAGDADLTEESERWEKDIDSLITEVANDDSLSDILADESNVKPAEVKPDVNAEPKAEAKPEAKAEVKELAKVSPGRATRGRGRGRGRGRRGN